MGKQCEEEGCAKLARGDTGYCIAHGGGKRCQHEVSRQLLQAVHRVVWRMAGANGVKRRAAPRWV
jgi:shikimate kinase